MLCATLRHFVLVLVHISSLIQCPSLDSTCRFLASPPCEAVDIWDEFTLEFSDHFSVELRGPDTPEARRLGREQDHLGHSMA